MKGHGGEWHDGAPACHKGLLGFPGSYRILHLKVRSEAWAASHEQSQGTLGSHFLYAPEQIPYHITSAAVNMTLQNAARPFGAAGYRLVLRSPARDLASSKWLFHDFKEEDTVTL